MPKYIFVTGGVLSSLGKGLTSAAIGTLLESIGKTVSFLKLDPYLNIDPGTMSPYQHGEVFVTQDGAETDLDLGHYERFTHAILNKHNSVTAGKLYSRLLEKERQGDFLGGTIQIIPHLTDEIKQTIYTAGQNSDYLIVEIGGTIGDIEGLPFIEAIRQMGLHQGRNDCVYIHLTYIPYLAASGDLKTKPTQHSVRQLCSLGIQPDILICRSEKELPTEIKSKISLFTNVEQDSIISAPDLKIIYELPLFLAKEGLHRSIARHLNVDCPTPNLTVWQEILSNLEQLQQTVTIAVVGKYTALQDAYRSLYEAIFHAQNPNNIKVKLLLIDAQDLTEDTVKAKLGSADGIIVPGGFGERGVEGKILAARYARENNIPYLGICLGMQIAVIEFARHVLNMPEAHSTEFIPATRYPVVDLMASQKEVTHKGGTMRLGSQVCKLKENTKAATIFGSNEILERHRHRFEFNASYADLFEQHGFTISGFHATNNLPEVVELRDHKFFIGCQFHPELQSKPFAPHALFVKFIQASIGQK